MGQRSDPKGQCPAGRDDCPLYSELTELRAECNRLLQLSVTDPLTGLYNVGYLLTMLDREMERTRRTGMPTGLVMMDIDHFKRINDTHGHYVGDRALQWLSRLLKGNVRKIDVPCRYGGEEFVIIVPGSDLHQTARLAERLRGLFAETTMELGTLSVKITASFGIVAYHGDEDFSVRRLLDAADRMLLRAKARGRNRVCGTGEDEMETLTEVTSEERAALFGSESEDNDNPAKRSRK